jgi:hypothetical protein
VKNTSVPAPLKPTVCVFSTHFLEKYSFSQVLENSLPILVGTNSRAVLLYGVYGTEVQRISGGSELY